MLLANSHTVWGVTSPYATCHWQGDSSVPCHWQIFSRRVNWCKDGIRPVPSAWLSSEVGTCWKMLVNSLYFKRRVFFKMFRKDFLSSLLNWHELTIDTIDAVSGNQLIVWLQTSSGHGQLVDRQRQVGALSTERELLATTMMILFTMTMLLLLMMIIMIMIMIMLIIILIW